MPNGKPIYTPPRGATSATPYSTQEQREHAAYLKDKEDLLRAAEKAFADSHGGQHPSSFKDPESRTGGSLYEFDYNTAKRLRDSGGDMSGAFLMVPAGRTQYHPDRLGHDQPHYPPSGTINRIGLASSKPLPVLGTKAFPYTRSMFSDDAKGMSEWMKLSVAQRAFGYQPDGQEWGSPAGRAKVHETMVGDLEREKAKRAEMWAQKREDDARKFCRSMEAYLKAEALRKAHIKRPFEYPIQPLPGHLNMQDKYYGK